MPPFSKANELVQDLVPAPSAAQNETLPGQPSILLKDHNRIKTFLQDDLWSEDLEKIAQRLWVMTTLSSANINPLHH
jgi:hypothetical protein